MKKSEILLPLTFVLLSACASTYIISTEPLSGLKTSKFHKALIISMARDLAIRRQVEDEFARQWRKRDIEVVASHEVLTPDVTMDKAGIAPFARNQGYDTVLVTRLVNLKTADRTVHVQKAGETPEDAATMTEYVQAVVASPEQPIDYAFAEVRVRVFDVATERQIWSCVSQTLITDDVPKHIRAFTKTILKKLYADGR